MAFSEQQNSYALKRNVKSSVVSNNYTLNILSKVLFTDLEKELKGEKTPKQ